MNPYLRASVILCLGCLLVSQAASQTVEAIFIGKSVEHVQTGDATVIVNPQATGPTYGGPYGFGVGVQGTGLSAPTVTLAAGSTQPSTNASAHNGGVLGYNAEDGEWAYGSPNFNNWGATSAGEIDTLFAAGDYTVAVPSFSPVTVTLGTTLANISSVVPSAPVFTLTGGNWVNGVYVVNVNQAVTITSNAFTGFSANADGHIDFWLGQDGGGLSDRAEWFYSDNTSADNFISYTINANTLVSGETYWIAGSFAAVLDLDASISGAKVGTYLDSSTSFQISAVPEPSTYAAIAGLCVLGFSSWHRRRRA